jgi:hypothetical protein
MNVVDEYITELPSCSLSSWVRRRLKSGRALQYNYLITIGLISHTFKC